MSLTKIPASMVDADVARTSDLTGIIPPGVVLEYSGASAPAGFLLCYGQAISRTDYAALFAAIGTAHGVGDGSTTFNVPDRRGRVAAGKDDMGGVAAGRLTTAGSSTDGATLGAVGGAQNVALTDTQIPGNVVGNYSLQTGATVVNVVTSGSHSATPGAAHTNVQPTIVQNFIIKT